jgi:hypothetical protein
MVPILIAAALASIWLMVAIPVGVVSRPRHLGARALPAGHHNASKVARWLYQRSGTPKGGLSIACGSRL